MLSDHYVDGGGAIIGKTRKMNITMKFSPGHVTAKQIVGKVMKTVRTEQNPVNNMIIASKKCMTHANIYTKLAMRSILNFSRIKIGFDHSYSPPSQLCSPLNPPSPPAMLPPKPSPSLVGAYYVHPTALLAYF